MSALKRLGWSVPLAILTLGASVMLAVLGSQGRLTPLFAPQMDVLHGAVIIGLSIIAAGLMAVTLNHYLAETRLAQTMLGRLEALQQIIDEADEMAAAPDIEEARRSLKYRSAAEEAWQRAAKADVPAPAGYAAPYGSEQLVTTEDRELEVKPPSKPKERGAT